MNSGTITNSGANPVGASSATLYFNDGAGVLSTIDNEGTTTGAGYVIQSDADALSISNSGTIHGGLYSAAAALVSNSGSWQSDTAETARPV